MSAAMPSAPLPAPLPSAPLPDPLPALGPDEDYLGVDDVPAGEPRFALVAFASPTRGAQRHTEPCIRVYGCFDEVGDAADFLDEHLGPAVPGTTRYDYDLFTLEVGRWHLAPVGDETPALAELKLQHIVKRYHEDQARQKEEFERYKADNVRRAEEEARKTPEERAAALEEAQQRAAAAALELAQQPAAEEEQGQAEHRRAPDKLARARVANQKFVIVAFAALEGLREPFALKFRGVYATLDEAKAEQERIKELDSAYDNYVLAIGGWAPAPPDPMAIETIHYREPFMDNLARGYQENRKNAERLQRELPPSMFGNAAPITIEQIPDPDPAPTPPAADGASTSTATPR